MKKRIAIPYSLLFAATLVAVFFMFKTTGLKNRLNKSAEEEAKIRKSIFEYESLFAIDSMLVKGDYKGVLDSYKGDRSTIEMVNNGVQLRIALAERFITLKSGIPNGNGNDTKLDTTQRKPSATLKELNMYDSLNFIVEKKQVQINGLRRQLEQKSYGEYLNFKSKKNSQMHYVGQVTNSMANGIGIALLDTGSRYEGEWKNNARHGEGKFYWADGEYYIGSYTNDKRSGMGTYYWPNGEKYVGQWADDKRNGAGTFYGADGKVITKGVWKNDKLNEERVVKTPKNKS